MEPLIQEDLAGRVVDHYAIVALIGDGGQGRVYRGRDERLHRDVAIKVLQPRRTPGAGRRGLIEEARALSLLNHPHVASIYDFVTSGRREYMVMEFVPGATLREILASGPLPWWEVVRLGAQVARGLAAAHAAQVVHRDIKPSNLKITSAGELKILDFGVSQLMPAGAVVDGARGSSRQTASGTLPYMAPEQLQGAPADVRSDIFSIGAVLYEMATGCRAFPQRELPALVYAVQHATPLPPTTANPHVPVALERVITMAMKKSPADRYQTAVELEDALHALMPQVNGHNQSDRRPSPPSSDHVADGGVSSSSRRVGRTVSAPRRQAAAR